MTLTICVACEPQVPPNNSMRCKGREVDVQCIAYAMHYGLSMKSATIPSLRVTPDLRHDAESVLKEGESLSSFVEQSLRRHIERRKLQNEFIARGLASREKAKSTGQYASKDEVMDSLRSILKASKEKG